MDEPINGWYSSCQAARCNIKSNFANRCPARGFEVKPDRYPNLTIKQHYKGRAWPLPPCKDDYSLQVDNLPKAAESADGVDFNGRRSNETVGIDGRERRTTGGDIADAPTYTRRTSVA